MNKRISVALRLFMLLALLASLGSFSTPTRAQGEGPAVEVIATGLDNPRGMTIGPDGALYVAESGSGGDECVAVDVEGEAVTFCLGLSGAVTRVWRGHQFRIAQGLPSYSGGPEGVASTGPNDIAFTPRGIRVVIGLGANPEIRDQLPPIGQLLGHMVQLVPGRKALPLVDLAEYEAEANPEPSMVDSNPYSVLNQGSKGIVVDAGGNSLLEVARDGTISTLAVFPPRMVPVPPELGLPFPEIPMDAVPNTVVVGPDGAYYVGQLTGFPFPVGGANVYRVVPGQAPEVYEEGFTAIIDIAFDRWGNLYVLEIAANGLLAAEMSGDFTGALIKVAPDGTRTTIMQEGLVAPTGLAVGRDGTLYVANNGIFPGAGEILKIRQ